MVKALLLNFALLWICIPALAFRCSYASLVINKIWNPLTVCGLHIYLLIHIHLRIPLTIYGIHLQLRNLEQLAILACCRIRDKTNMPTKFMLHVFVRGNHENFVSGNHLKFGTCLKICQWNPGTYRHKLCDCPVHSLDS